MLGALVLLTIFVALALLAIWFADITKIILIVLFVAVIANGVAFLSLGLHLNF